MSDNDIAILKIIHESGDMATIGFLRGTDIAADSRLEYLTNQGFIKNHIPNSDDRYAGDYELTAKGYAFLSDYDLGIQKAISSRKRELFSSIYVPLFVTIAANIVIELIKALLSK